MATDVPREEDFSVYKEKILNGRLDVLCPPVVKMVRIFTSSTFTDTKLERNAWMKKSYPVIQEECEKRGYDFQVVDMRWGIRKEMESVHATEDLCLNEIKNCDERSTGPSFVTLCAQKYGWCPYPTKISKEHYEILTNDLSKEEKTLIDRWYKLDENSVPAHYVILPKTKHYPDYISKNFEKQKEASAKFNEECDKFTKIIAREASKNNSEDMEKYLISVTEKEIRKGILDKPKEKVKEQCLWMHRHITNMETSKKEKVREYKDESEEKQKLLDILKEKKMKKWLPNENIIEERLDWSTATDSSSSEHKSYIDRFCKAFNEKLLHMIDEGIEKRKRNSDPLLSEISCHVVHCQKLNSEFWGREKLLECAKSYIYGENIKPLNLHGVKGCGKSFLAAQIVRDLQTDTKSIVIFRFCNLTEETQQVTTTFYNIYLQMCQVLNEEEKSVDKNNYGDICAELSGLIKKSKQKLVLILDAIDAPQPPEESSNHAWIPQPLPKNIKIILTTESEVGSGENYTHEEVPAFVADELEGILSHLLSLQNRTLNKPQKDFVCKTLNKFPSSDMMKLTYDVVVKWTSNEEIQISDSGKVTGDNFLGVLSCNSTEEAIEYTIKNLFSELEKKHGEELVKKTSLYLVMAERGLTEKELIELLSDHEEVLKQVENGWWEIVDRKIPIAVLLRLLHDLNVALNTLDIDGVPVIVWKNQALKQQERMVSQEPVGIEKIVRDLYLSKQNQKVNAERVCLEKMANYFIGLKNKSLRKLNNLPWILTKLDVKRLKTECLCNFDFILAKMESVGVHSVIDDISRAVSVHGAKKMDDFLAIQQVLKISQTALSRKVHQLPAHILGRIILPNTPSAELEQFLNKCRNPGFTTLVSKHSILTPINGNPTCCVPVHGGTKVTDLLLTKDGKTAITAGNEKGRCQLQFWNVEKEQPKSTLNTIDDKVWKIFLAEDDKYILVISLNDISIYDTSKMTFCSKYVFSEHPCNSEDKCPVVCLGGKDNTIIGLFWNDHYRIIPLTKGHVIEDKDKIIDKRTGKMESPYKSSKESLSAGSESFMAWTDEHGILLRRYNLDDNSMKTRRIYDTFKRQSNKNKENKVGDSSPRIDAICFTEDGSGIFVSSKHYTDILILNAEDCECIGIIKGKGEYCPEIFRLAPGNLLYFPSNRQVIVINVDEESSKHLEKHPWHIKVAAISLLPTKQYCVLTVADDGNLRFWKYDNFFKKEIPKSLPVIKSITFIPNDSRNCVIHSKADCMDKIQIWDVEKNIAVRTIIIEEVNIKKLEMIGTFDTTDEVHVLLQDKKGKLSLLNLEKREFVKRYKFEEQILVKEFMKTFSYIKKTKDILGIKKGPETLTRFYLAGKKIKSSEICDSKCRSYLVNHEETILVIETNTKFLIYQLLPKLKNSNEKAFISLDRKESTAKIRVNSKGNFFVHEDEDGRFSLLKVVGKDDTKTINPDRGSLSVEINSVAFLPNEKLLCSFFDGSIRILSLEGKTLHTNKEHIGDKICIDGNEECNFYLTYRTDANDQTIHIWEVTNHDLVASFTSDTALRDVKLGADGCSVWAGVQDPFCVARFQIKANNEKPNSLQGKSYGDVLIIGPMGYLFLL